jgi:hypothetical protein
MKIFVSYSHRDSDWVSEDGKYQLIPWLKEQLEGEAEIWTDHVLKQLIGDDYTKLIKSKIQDADIIILLISQNFAKPGFIHDVELPLIKQQYDKETTKVIPLLISRLTASGKRKLNWIFDLQTYPNDTRPILDFVHDSARWEDVKVDILEGIENKIETINNSKSDSEFKENGNSPANLNKTNSQSKSTGLSQEENLSSLDCFNEGQEYDKREEYSKAMKWYIKAAKIGSTAAMNNIAWLFENGQGVQEDYNKAMEWYLKAAENGNNTAMYNIGFLYKNAIGVNKDIEFAKKWYTKACKNGNKDACDKLKELQDEIDSEKNKQREIIFLKAGHKYFERREFNEAMKWYKLADELGNVEAKYKIAILYEGGQGVPQDLRKAMEWYEAAANKGHARAALWIAFIYESGGAGVTKDMEKAKYWFKKACENGDDLACERLKKL